MNVMQVRVQGMGWQWERFKACESEKVEWCKGWRCWW